MSLQVEKLENNTAKLTIEVPAEELDKAIQKAYQKNKKYTSKVLNTSIFLDSEKVKFLML